MVGKLFAYCPHSGAVYRQWDKHTVSRRDQPEVHRRRLEIEQRVEDFLGKRNELTQERLQAINQARFETARMIWLYNNDFARHVVAIIQKTQPGFIPAGKAAPPSYRAVYRAFGFKLAERLAALRRRLTDETI
jgi:hypothetical protein